MKVYLAGPLFMPYEREFLDGVAARLRAEGFDVFVPHEQEFVEFTPETVFATDGEGLLPANAILALLDGTGVDDGTACEIGIFWGMKQAGDVTKKGIVGLVTDSRVQRGQISFNLFLQGCIEDSGGIAQSVDEAVELLVALRDGRG